MAFFGLLASRTRMNQRIRPRRRDNFSSGIENFFAENAAWIGAEHHGAGHSTYALPEEVISRLAQPAVRARPLISPDEANVEEAYRALCIRSHAVGFHRHRPIINPLVDIGESEIPAVELAHLVSTAPVELSMELAEEIVSDRVLDWALLRGYIGWLLTNHEYLSELHQLRSRIESAIAAAPAFDEVRFPLMLNEMSNCQAVAALDECIEKANAGSGNASELRDRFAANQQVVDAHGEAGGFLEKWNLVQLTSWELPFPMVPAISNRDASCADSTRFPSSIGISTPSFYKDYLDLIDEMKKRNTGTADSASEFVQQSRSAPTFSHIFVIQHFERVLRDRYPGLNARRGAASAMETAFADHLELSLERIRVLRKKIQRRLRRNASM